MDTPQDQQLRMAPGVGLISRRGEPVPVVGLAAGAIPAEELRVAAEEVRSAFPRPISDMGLVLIDVDPYHVHAFWNMSLATVESVRAEVGGTAASAPMILRLEPEDGSTPPVDIEVQGLQGQIYVPVSEKSRRYRGMLGIRPQAGELRALTAERTVELPRLMHNVSDDVSATTKPLAAAPKAVAEKGRPADVFGPLWDEPDRPPLAEPYPSPPTEASEYDPFAASGIQSHEAGPDKPATLVQGFESKPISTLPVTVGAPPPVAERLSHPVALWDEPESEPLVEPFPSPPTEASDFDPFAGQPGPSDDRAASSDSGNDAPQQGESGSEAGTGAGSEAGASPPGQNGLALENVLSLSSFVLGQGEDRAPSDDVQLEVNVELRVFGRSKPNSNLYLFGERITLLPDGTFSFSRPLPNGALVISAMLAGNGKKD